MAKRQTAPAKPQPASDAEASEYDAFEDLARRLVKVPKKELDEERDRAQARSGSDD